MTLDALIEELTKAQQASSHLDKLIAEAVPDLWPDGEPPKFTSSIESAMLLLDDGWPLDVHIGPHRLSNEASVFVPRVFYDEKGRRCITYDEHKAETVHEGTLYYNTPALVICIAALKARKATQEAKNAE